MDIAATVEHFDNQIKNLQHTRKQIMNASVNSLPTRPRYLLEHFSSFCLCGHFVFHLSTIILTILIEGHLMTICAKSFPNQDSCFSAYVSNISKEK